MTCRPPPRRSVSGRSGVFGPPGPLKGTDPRTIVTCPSLVGAVRSSMVGSVFLRYCPWSRPVQASTSSPPAHRRCLSTLSGGEAQRLKLAGRLASIKERGGLVLLDEPTRGLHAHDIRLLVNVIQQLVEGGDTVITVEHDMDVVKCADWIVDLGPEGGEKGGRVVAAGPPEKIAATKKSHTGRYLKKILPT